MSRQVTFRRRRGGAPETHVGILRFATVAVGARRACRSAAYRLHMDRLCQRTATPGYISFEGDDDLCVFIDKRRAIDLGGIHAATQGSVVLDQFASEAGLVVGEVYSLDLFNAERHPSGSNFKITTSMTFVDCGVRPPVN